ncbi:MAG: hypothetical protein LUG91_08960 [Ruminococcus sp.]|nr:hypothetical protein [Ruminococcus sp.]
MVENESFSKWLSENTSYSNAVISDTVSRMKRADNTLPYNDGETYLFYLEKQDSFKALSVTVRSQIRKAVKLYDRFRHSTESK